MHIITETVINLWRSNRKTRQSTSGWISGNAPCCHHRGETQDDRGRGGIMISNNGFVFSCFNCGFKAGFTPGKVLSKNSKDLLLWLGLPQEDINKLFLLSMKERESINIRVPEINTVFKEVDLPKNSRLITEWINDGCEDSELLDCLAHIDSRRLTIDDYDWMWSSESGYRDRLLMPFYNNGKIVGWTGRKLKPGTPKYLSSSQTGYIFNIDSQLDHWKFAIVVEGQFDAIAIKGVAAMQNILNDSQVFRLKQLNREIIVVPDRDSAGAKMLDVAIENGWSISCPPWESHIKDVSDAVKHYGKIYVLKTILHYRERNKLKQELLKRKLENKHD